MADYIRGNILAQAYVNFIDVEFTEEVAIAIKRKVSENARPLLANAYPFPVLFEVEVDEGSIKVKATAIAVTLAAFYKFIGGYGDFVGGVDALNKHGKWFAERTNEIIVGSSPVVKDAEYASEARTGIPGVMRNIAHELEYLARNTNSLPPDEISSRLHTLSKKALHLAEKPSSREDQFLTLEAFEDFSSRVLEQSRGVPDLRNPLLSDSERPLVRLGLPHWLAEQHENPTHEEPKERPPARVVFQDELARFLDELRRRKKEWR